ncbi:MAG: sugar phosphate isomerase/epimerase [Promethearchaeota archaeon]|nr:MAG: sugar phosphate isomerase/epimerase [Candidatus Lokiarchaeota archaeon]
MIKLALNQNSCKDLSLLEFIKFSRDFKGIELNFKKIKRSLSKNLKLKDILETLEIYNLRVFSIFHLKDFSLCSEKEYKTKVLNNLMQMFNLCYKLDSNLIIVNPSKLELSSEDNIIPKWRVINRTIKRLENLSKKAYDEDINIGFEFLGSIPTLNDAMEVLEPFESQENLGYIINTRYISDSDYNQLKKIKDFIFLIKLSDLKYDEEDITDISKDFIKFTQKIGYSKVYSIELSEEECLDNLYKKFNMKFEMI